MIAPVEIARLAAHVFRYPLATPVQTSFGTMHDRPMLLVEAEGSDGTIGWGEVWCNFPTVGAEHRARLIDSVIAPLVVGRAFSSPAEVFETLTASLAVLAIQSAEPGPFAQAIAGVDIALWDVAARQEKQPLWRFLNADANPHIKVYASGLNPTNPERLAAERQAAGHTAFKLKVGFGRERDLANLRALRQALGDAATLMVDANQGWDGDEAAAMAAAMADFDLGWLEEPLRADTPWPAWQQLAAAAPMPLAAGENIVGPGGFREALAAGVFGVMQPDIAKWGGFSGCVPVARAVLAGGVRFCPHYLGGGIGLLASAHLLAAAGGGGMLEIDANPNPLRSLLEGPLATIAAGRASLSDTPGLGLAPDLAVLAAHRVPH